MGDANGLVESINAITLVTRDMARAVRFYQDLGFKAVHGGPAADFTSLASGTCFVNITTRDVPAVVSFWGRIIFHVRDVDAVHATAVAAGYTPEFEPRDAQWGERYFHLCDPDGHALSFARLLQR